MIVISIITDTGEERFNPPGDHVLGRADTMLVIGRSGCEKRLRELELEGR